MYRMPGMFETSVQAAQEKEEGTKTQEELEQEILDTLGIDIAQLEADGKVTYGTNVTEVANQVKEAAVDCGIIYATDAFTYELNVVDAATEDMCSQVIYPAAVMKSGTAEAQEAAQAFLDYLHTDAGAIAVLEGVGFTVIQ